MLLGAHESVAGGVQEAFPRAAADGCESLQIFTRSGRAWTSKPLEPADIAAFKAAHKASPLPVLAHGAYLVNLASDKADNRAKSIACFTDELLRSDALGVAGYVFHPGSHPDAAAGLKLVASALDEICRATPGVKTKILIEATAGQGACLGHRFEHLAELLSTVAFPERIGICLDSCHLFAAGYDLRTEASYEKVMGEFGRLVGFEHVQGFHLNDCIKPLGCRVDRHASLGEGSIGLETFRLLVRDERFAKVPAVLETPDPERYRTELELLRGLRTATKPIAAGASPKEPAVEAKPSKSQKKAPTTTKPKPATSTKKAATPRVKRS